MIIAPSIRGGNSIKDILGDLKRDYGLNLLDEWETNPQTDIRYKKYYK